MRERDPLAPEGAISGVNEVFNGLSLVGGIPPRSGDHSMHGRTISGMG